MTVTAFLTCSIAIAATSLTPPNASLQPEFEWGQFADGFRLSAYSPHSTFATGNKVQLRVYLQNVSQESQVIGTASGLAMFKLKIVGPGGTPIPMTKRGEELLDSLRQGPYVTRNVNPKEKLPFFLDVFELFGMDKPGKYQITVLPPKEKRASSHDRVARSFHPDC